MTHRQLQLIISGLLFSLLAFNAQAERSFDDSWQDDINIENIYAGIKISMGKHDCTVNKKANQCDNMRWSGVAGYRFNDTISAEAAYHSLSSDINGFSLSAIGKYPVMDEMNAYGSVGSLIWSDAAHPFDRTTKHDLLFGAGVSYQLNDNLTLQGGLEAAGGVLNLRNYQLGATYSTL